MASLVKELDKVVAANKDKNLSAVLNFTGEPNDAYFDEIKAFGDKYQVKNVALTMTADKDRFKVSDEADVTVMHYNRKKVMFNYAAKGELSDKEVAAIVKGTKKILN